MLKNEEREANRLHKQQLHEDAIKWLDKAGMYKRVSEWTKAEPALAKVHSQVLQDVVDRVDEGTKRWFDALKSGRTGVLTVLASAGRELLEQGLFPVGGQPIVMRGGNEGGSGESPTAEQAGLALESSMKRKSPASSLSMATPGVRKLPERTVSVHGRTGAARGKARRAGMKPADAGDSAARAETAINPLSG